MEYDDKVLSILIFGFLGVCVTLNLLFPPTRICNGVYCYLPLFDYNAACTISNN